MRESNGCSRNRFFRFYGNIINNSIIYMGIGISLIHFHSFFIFFIIFVIFTHFLKRDKNFCRMIKNEFLTLSFFSHFCYCKTFVILKCHKKHKIITFHLKNIIYKYCFLNSNHLFIIENRNRTLIFSWKNFLFFFSYSKNIKSETNSQ